MKNNINTLTNKNNINLKLQKVFIFIFSFALYACTIGFDYTLDDTLMITGNQYTQEGINGIKSIFTTDAFYGFFNNDSNLVAGGRYRPLTHFMFAIEKELFGFNPIIGHLANVLFYILLIFSLFRLLKKLIPYNDSKKWFLDLPFLITILFATHPLHTEVVANIKGRDEIIAMLMAILSINLLINWLSSKKIFLLPLATLLFFLALLSKENAITWIGIFPFILWFFTSAKTKDYIITISTLIVPSVIFVIIRSQIVGGVLSTNISPELLNNPFIDSSKSQEIATVLFTWLMYFKLLIFPHPLTHDYYPKQIAITDFSDIWVWVSIIITVTSIYLAIKGLKKKKIYSFAIILFWASFSISSNLLFNIGTFMNERFMFVPLLGFVIILALLISKIKNQNIATFIIISIATLYSIKTVSRNFVWKDNFTLFTTDVKTSNNSAKVNVSAAELLIEKAESENNIAKKNKMLSQAIAYLNKAETIHPTYFGVYDLRGKAEFLSGNYNNSFENYKHCISLDSSNTTSKNNIYLVGLACTNKNIIESGLKIFDYLISIEPDSAKYYYNKALLLDFKHNTNESIQYLQKTISKDSSFALAYNKMGEIYGRVLNDFASSEKFLLKALELDPYLVSALENLGVLYGITKKYEKSKNYLLKAHSLSPNDKKITSNLVQTYMLTGQKDSANYFATK